MQAGQPGCRAQPRPGGGFYVWLRLPGRRRKLALVLGPDSYQRIGVCVVVVAVSCWFAGSRLGIYALSRDCASQFWCGGFRSHTSAMVASSIRELRAG